MLLDRTRHAHLNELKFSGPNVRAILSRLSETISYPVPSPSFAILCLSSFFRWPSLPLFSRLLPPSLLSLSLAHSTPRDSRSMPKQADSKHPPAQKASDETTCLKIRPPPKRPASTAQETDMTHSLQSRSGEQKPCFRRGPRCQ